MSKERRSYVRGVFPFKVKFKLLTPEEYKAVRETNQDFRYPEEDVAGSFGDPDKGDAETGINASLMEFLLQMDQKLDHILSMVSRGKVGEELLAKQGTGVNISGSGMSLVVEEPVAVGQIMHAHFILSRIPLVFMEVFGEVKRVDPVEENGITRYDLGIEFVDLKPIDRERIIACVFQRQRKNIRERKAEGEVA